MTLCRRFSTLGVVGALLITIAACEEPPAEESNVTAKPRVTFKFDVTAEIRGEQTSSTASAEQSWKAACDRWASTLAELAAPAEVESFDCKASRPLVGGSISQFASDAVATIRTTVPEGMEPASSAPGDVMGVIKSSETGAIVAWRDACESELRHVKSIYGVRLVAATCGTPTKHANGSTIGYKSSPTIWVAPEEGTVLTLASVIPGTGRDEVVAHTAWRATCDSWVERTSVLTGVERLGAFTCGERKTLSSGSTWDLESAASVDIVVRLEDGSEPEQESFTAKGAESSSQAAAKASAISACEAEIAVRKASHGERFLAGSCETLRALVTGSSSQYEATGVVYAGDIAKVEEPAPDTDPVEPAPAGPDAAKTQPVANCTDRCLALMDKCNAGPREDTCAFICDATPTEGEMECAEAVSCEDVGAWFNVCQLGS